MSRSYDDYVISAKKFFGYKLDDDLHKSDDMPKRIRVYGLADLLAKTAEQEREKVVVWLRSLEDSNPEREAAYDTVADRVESDQHYA